MTPTSPHGQCHAQKMDRTYRYQKYIYDFTRKYYLVGRDRLIGGLDLAGGNSALEVGCGTGRNLIMAARKFPDARFFGVDISRQMLDRAEAAIHRTGLNNRTRTALGDAETFNPKVAFAIAEFDRVFFSYSLSMVPNWRQALSQASKQIGASGSIHIIDFGQLEGWPPIARQAMKHWLAQFHVTPRRSLIYEAKNLARVQGFQATTDRIAGGYAWLIVLSQC